MNPIYSSALGNALAVRLYVWHWQVLRLLATITHSWCYVTLGAKGGVTMENRTELNFCIAEGQEFLNTIFLGDCIEVMKDLPDNSVDMVLCDLPYGVTQARHDLVINPELLWEQYWRIVKANGAVVLFGQDKFTANMMLSDKNHKYNLIWDKVLTSGFLNANRMPLRSHEDIMVFYRKLPTYNPQKVKGKPNHSKGAPKKTANNNYGEFEFVDNKEKLGDLKHPKSILSFEKPHPSIATHPTEKPVDLFEWLIKTYTNEGETVLDNTAGSGTTGVACKNTGRNYVLIEKDRTHFETAFKRVGGNTKIYAPTLL